MWVTLAVALIAAGPRPPLALRGGGAPESELLDSLNTAKLRLHALEHRLKTSRDTKASDTGASPGRAEGLEPVIAEPEAGDRVRVRSDVATPRYEWGEGVDHASVGRLTWCAAVLTRTPRGLPALEPLACCRYRWRRAAGPWAPRTARKPYHTPASGVPHVPRPVATWHPTTTGSRGRAARWTSLGTRAGTGCWPRWSASHRAAASRAWASACVCAATSPDPPTAGVPWSSTARWERWCAAGSDTEAAVT